MTEDGWMPLSRHPGSGHAEQVRLDILLRRATMLRRRAYDFWMSGMLLSGMGGVVTDEHADRFLRANDEANQATAIYHEALLGH